MLSYLHSFHAGNFADILKHSISTHILNYLNEKPKPFFYLDTHSGAGAFSLTQGDSQKTQEYLDGIFRLWLLTDEQKSRLAPLTQNYLKLIQQFNSSRTLTSYPGYPWFAREIMQENGRLNLFELHPREFKNLLTNIRGDRRVKAFQADGFHACLSQLPPKERRGYVLMDPPYEVKQDYQTAVDALISAHKRFATGTYALCYPVVDRYRIKKLEQQFKASGIANIQLFELGVKEALPPLVKLLAGAGGFYRCEQLVSE